MSVEFFSGAYNFTIGQASFENVAGDSHNHSVRKERNTYRDGDNHHTTYRDSFNNNSRTYNRDYYNEGTVNQGPVNNVREVENGNFGMNYGNVEQNRRNTNREQASRPQPPGSEYYSNDPQGVAATGYVPRPQPPPEEFAASAPVLGRYPQGPQDLPHRNTDPPRPRPQESWQQDQAYYRPRDAYPPPGRQAQPQGRLEERWPGERTYKQGMEELKLNGLSGTDSENSDSDDGPGRFGKTTNRMEDPDKGWAPTPLLGARQQGPAGVSLDKTNSTAHIASISLQTQRVSLEDQRPTGNPVRLPSNSQIPIPHLRSPDVQIFDSSSSKAEPSIGGKAGGKPKKKRKFLGFFWKDKR